MKSILVSIVAAVLLVGCGGPSAPDISIHKAAGDGNIVAVKQHLAAGTDVNAKDIAGSTPLHEVRTKKIAELLVAEGADVNAKDSDGWTPLYFAANGGHKEIVELLIAKGANVNAKNVDGETPLDWVDFAHGSTADLLRKHEGKSGVGGSNWTGMRKLEKLKAAGN